MVDWGLLRSQTLIMVDVSDRGAIVAALRDAQRRFEKGAPVPRVAEELLRELADALANSGPSELGVTSEAWLAAVDAAALGIANTDAEPPSPTVRRAKRSLRKLDLFFRRKHTWGDYLLLLLAVAIVIGPPIAIVVSSHDKPKAAVLSAVVIAALFVSAFLIGRNGLDAEKVGTQLDLPDRQLFAHAVKASDSEANSFAHAKFVLIATDGRLVLARAANELSGRSDGNEFRLAGEIAYRDITTFSTFSTYADSPDITTFSSTITGGDSPNEIVTVHSREREVSYRLPSDDGKALVANIRRRAPEVFGGSASLTRPARPSVATTRQHVTAFMRSVKDLARRR